MYYVLADYFNNLTKLSETRIYPLEVERLRNDSGSDYYEMAVDVARKHRRHNEKIKSIYFHAE